MNDVDAESGTVILAVSEEMGVDVDDILGRSRLAEVVEARQLVAYLLGIDYGLDAAVIGRVLDRDRSTVLHSIQKTRRRLRLETTLLERLERIRAVLR